MLALSAGGSALGITQGTCFIFSIYGGTGHKFCTCRFHKRGLLPSPPVEPTKLMPCTLYLRILIVKSFRTT